MNKYLFPVAVAAALAVTAMGDGQAKAQYVYSSPGYYGGYSSYPAAGILQTGGGQILGIGGLGYNTYPGYTSGYGGFNGFSNYGGTPYLSNGYSSYYSSYGNRGYYGGGRRYGWRRY